MSTSAVARRPTLAVLLSVAAVVGCASGADDRLQLGERRTYSMKTSVPIFAGGPDCKAQMRDARAGLAVVGVVDSAPDEPVLLGEIPPYRVKATCAKKVMTRSVRGRVFDAQASSERRVSITIDDVEVAGLSVSSEQEAIARWERAEKTVRASAPPVDERAAREDPAANSRLAPSVQPEDPADMAP